MRRKKLVGIAALVLTPLVVLAAGAYGLYKNQELLTQRAISSVNEQFAGELAVGQAHISPFANFPYLSVDLQGVKFFETKSKQTHPLYEAEDVYIGFSVLDILLGHFRVKRIQIQSGYINIVRDDRGELNLLRAKNMRPSSETEEKSEAFSIELKQLVLKDFTLSYIDEMNSKTIRTHIDLLRSQIKLNEQQLLLGVEADLIVNLLDNEEPTFFSNKDVHLDWLIDYDLVDNQLTVLPSRMQLDEGLFSLEGTVDVDDELNTDLKLYGEKPDFSIFTAFAPKEVTDALRKYQNEGHIYFLGTIVGKAAAGNSPAIAVEFGCENAYFLNTNQNKRIDELNFSGFYTNGKERSLKTSEIRLQNFYARPEEGVFEGKLVIRDFEDPYINVELHADLDLEFIGAFFEVEGLEKLKGQVILDMDLDEIIDSEVPKLGMAKLKDGIDSELRIEDLSFLVPGQLHPVSEANGLATMQDGKIQLNHLSFTIGDSDFNFSGSISDFPALFHGLDKDVSIHVRSNSDRILLAQLLPLDSAGILNPNEQLTEFQLNLALEANAHELTNFNYLPKARVRVEDFHAKLTHYPHAFHDFDVSLTLADSSLQVDTFSGEIDGSDFQFSGSLSPYTNWFDPVNKGSSRFDFTLQSELLKIKDLLTYNGENYLPESYRDEALSEFYLSGSLALHYDTVFQSADLHLSQMDGKLRSHPIKLENFAGRVHYENGTTLVENFGGQLGESDFTLNMSYFSGADSTVKARPNFFSLQAEALDLDALLNYHPEDTAKVAHDTAFNVFNLPFSEMDFAVDIGKLNYHRYWLEEVKAAFRTTEDHYLYVDTLSLRTAEGSLGMKGYFNGSDPSHIYFHSTMRADKLDLDKLMVKFENFGQDYLINENLHGKVSGTITSKFLVHPDLTPILEQSEAHMELTVQEGSLVNFTPFQAMSAYFKDKNLNLVRFDTLENTFDLKNGVLHIPKMTVNSSLGFIELSGMQGLDLNMDYFIRIPLGLVTQVGMRSLFAGNKQEGIDPEQEDEIIYRDPNRRTRFININVKGTPEEYEFRLGKDKKNR
ncbi:AsmA-like C-terminal region-containing protein [Cyclobacterium xiamenense]|uniref:AsmA-like C-terminal region-containing protein n=1 Tax=Cyclobacterium xiamenense TaxID=1297121 RepID=UPI0012B6E413|nr:AsmA-like C-terminal region-containing protein [Cyclobacterium xiamenense]